MISKLKNCFLDKPIPFSKKQELKWGTLGKYLSVGGLISLVVFLLLPEPKEEAKSFKEQAPHGTLEPSQPSESLSASNSVDDWANNQSANNNYVTNSYLSSYSSPSPPGHAPSNNSSMVIVRKGAMSGSQVPAGIRFKVRLQNPIQASQQAVPVIGVVESDVDNEGASAIPAGSKIYGEAFFDSDLARAQISWKSLSEPNGISRDISAIGVDGNGQLGVDGTVHSKAFKNIAGHTLSRFVGAYAEGSIERGTNGQSLGGAENGMRTAISETAKDRAQEWAEDMKKPSAYIELKAGTICDALLTQPYTFRDPGSL